MKAQYIVKNYKMAWYDWYIITKKREGKYAVLASDSMIKVKKYVLWLRQSEWNFLSYEELKEWAEKLNIWENWIFMINKVGQSYSGRPQIMIRDKKYSKL